MVEPAPAEVADAFMSLAVVALEAVDHAAMRDGENVAEATGVFEDRIERGRHAGEQDVVGLPARRPTAFGERARELDFDLVAGEAGVLAGIAFLETRGDDDGADPDR